MTKNPSMMVALTGGSGFVGSRILDNLLTRGYYVRALQNHTKIQPHKNLEIVSGNLFDAQSLNKLVKGTSCVIHCGGAVSARNAQAFFLANEQGTINLVKAAQDQSVEKFLYISSIAAREPSVSPYAASKRAGEKIVQSSNIKGWDIIRPPAIYGPGDVQILPLMRFLKMGVGLLVGNQRSRVSVIYVDDLAGAVASWLLMPSPCRNIYEIDDGQKDGYEWRTLLQMAADEMNVKPYFVSPPRNLVMVLARTMKTVSGFLGKTTFLTPEKLNEFFHPDWVRYDRRLEDDIDWKPQVDFQKGIIKTLSWYQDKGLLKNLNLRKAL